MQRISRLASLAKLWQETAVGWGRQVVCTAPAAPIPSPSTPPQQQCPSASSPCLSGVRRSGTGMDHRDLQKLLCSRRHPEPPGSHLPPLSVSLGSEALGSPRRCSEQIFWGTRVWSGVRGEGRNSIPAAGPSLNVRGWFESRWSSLTSALSP